ncbi:MAG: DUF2190 family protein [Candidatus Gastranaerophilaceae bacterium]
MTAVNSFIQEGKSLDYTNSGSTTINYLDIVVETDRIFIANCTIVAGATGSVLTEGVFEFPAVTNAAFTFGQKLYYNATSGVITSMAAGNIYVGYAVEAKATETATIKVKLVDVNSISKLANQPASVATTVAGAVADLNTLIAALKTKGFMTPDA